MRKPSFVSAVLLAMLFSRAAQGGGAYIKHDWGLNPLGEGWTLKDDSNGGHRFYRATFDAMGKNTWGIDTSTNRAAGIGAYQYILPKLGDHWVLSADLKLIDTSDLGGQAIRVGSGVPAAGGGTRLYGLLFSTAADGDPIVALEGTSFSMEIEGGAGNYQKYKLDVRERTNNMRSEFFVNGVSVFRQYFGFGATLPDGQSRRVEWGDLFESAAVNGRANYAVVKLSDPTPEPDTIVLIASCIGLLASRCRVRLRCRTPRWTRLPR